MKARVQQAHAVHTCALTSQMEYLTCLDAHFPSILHFNGLSEVRLCRSAVQFSTDVDVFLGVLTVTRFT